MDDDNAMRLATLQRDVMAPDLVEEIVAIRSRERYPSSIA